MNLGGLLANRRAQRHYRSDGCRRSRKKPLLNFARPFLSLLNRQQLPNIVDLRSLLSPIEEQYTLGSCVGNALASILEYFYFYTTGHRKIFSRLFIYYNARMMEDEVSQRNATENDSGADLQFAIVSLFKYGCCEEQFWPFYEHLINIQPNNQAYENGQNYRLEELSRLSNNITQLRECLAEGYPFVMAIKTFPSFAFNHDGFIPMPKSHEKSSQYRHAVVCVGYIHSERVFIIRNSHGIQWGDHGYGYLPYEYVTNKILTKDLWAIKSVKNMIIEQHIPSNDSSMLPRSISRQDLADDRSNFDIVDSSDNEEEEEELENRQYFDGYSPERQRDYLAASAQQQIPFMNNRPPIIFANPSPYHPSMFGSAPFFGPF